MNVALQLLDSVILQLDVDTAPVDRIGDTLDQSCLSEIFDPPKRGRLPLR